MISKEWRDQLDDIINQREISEFEEKSWVDWSGNTVVTAVRKIIESLRLVPRNNGNIAITFLDQTMSIEFDKWGHICEWRFDQDEMRESMQKMI